MASAEPPGAPERPTGWKRLLRLWPAFVVLAAVVGFYNDIKQFVMDLLPEPPGHVVIIGRETLTSGMSPCASEAFSGMCARLQVNVKQQFEREFPQLQRVVANNCQGLTEQAWLYETGYAILLRRYVSADCADFITYEIPTHPSEITKLAFVRRDGTEAYHPVEAGYKTLAGEPFDLLEVVRFCEDIRPWDIIRVDAGKLHNAESQFRGEVNLARDQVQSGPTAFVFATHRLPNGDLSIEERNVAIRPFTPSSSVWARLVSDALPMLHANAAPQPIAGDGLTAECAGGTIGEQLREHGSLVPERWVSFGISTGIETNPDQYLVFVGRR